ncbi:hypothetical protein C8J56DRAFT_898691 [Mycena floridula]|nr:hypothetical protein C8J56DRAFT_898691 [Mycena floridula]
MKSFVPPTGAYFVFELEPEATLEMHCDVTDEAAVEEVRKLSFKKYIGCTVKIIDDPPRPARNYNRVSICPVNWATISNSTMPGDSVSERPVPPPISVRISTELRVYGSALKVDGEAPVPRVSPNSKITAYSESESYEQDLLSEEPEPIPEPDSKDWDDEKASTVFEKPSMVITLVARDTTPEEDLEFTPIVRVSSEYMTELACQDTTELYEEYKALQRIVEATNQRCWEASNQFAKEHGMVKEVTGVEMSTGRFDSLNPERDSAFSCKLMERLGGKFRDRRPKMRSKSAPGDNEKTSERRKIWKRLKSRLKPAKLVPYPEHGGTSRQATAFFGFEGQGVLVNKYWAKNDSVAAASGMKRDLDTTQV